MLTRGTRLGPYEIVAAVGAGGMGEVYKARDTRLDRTVAVKILSAGITDSPELRERFDREARTVASLTHPHICTLHDVGIEGATAFLVMEFLEGTPLDRRLEEGALPVTEALRIADDIADAVAAAHRRGIVHRDLKPSNIFLTPGGAKLLDFGLAHQNVTDADVTRALSITREGAVLGTLRYMAPEQLAGQPADARADVFSFGVVLYEMITGVKFFPDANRFGPAHDPGARADDLPLPMRALVRRCVEHDPVKRYADAEALRIDLAAAEAWVQRDAIPSLLRIADRLQFLDEGPDPWSAFELAAEIDRMCPGEPLLDRIWPLCSRQIDILTDPPGAQVFAKYYGNPQGPWRAMGRTPLEAVRYPRGFTRLRVEMAGYRTMHDLLWNFESVLGGASDTGATTWRYDLRRPGDIRDSMEEVPAGEYPMLMPGLDHLVAPATDRFLMDRHPVTNREYKQFVDAGGYRRREWWHHPFYEDGREMPWVEAMSRFVDSVGQPGPATWELGEYPAGQDDLPVGGVSWFEACAFAAFVGKRLPTVFHWNRVAFTAASSEIIPLANLGAAGPVPIGSTASLNRFGVHDLAGNTREWAWNECSRNSERFILGGGWNDLEYAFHDAYTQPPFDRSPTNGFRCISDLVDEPHADRLTGVIDLPSRDFRAETPVGDEVYAIFQRQFRYDKSPLHARIEAEATDWIAKREKITFAAAYGGERMTAYLFLPPQTQPPYQTVVIFPGSFAIHASAIGPAELRRIDFLLKAGRAVVLPVYKGTFERGDDLQSDYPEATNRYRDHVVMWSKDLGRTIDYLETRPDIDAERLAYFGLSWGGALGAILPAIVTRLKVLVLYVAGLLFQRAFPEVEQINHVTRVTQPTLMLNGEFDFYFPPETSQEPMFEMLGTAPEHKKRLVFPGGHSVPRTALVKETLEWLDRYLGPVKH